MRSSFIRSGLLLSTAIFVFNLSLSPSLAEESGSASENSGSSHIQVKTEQKVETHSEHSVSISTKNTTEVKTSLASQSAELKLRLENMKNQIKQRLDQTKLKVCQNRQQQIISHTGEAITKANRLFASFEAILTKVEQFKTTKSLTVDNYDALVADVAAKKTALQTAMTTVQANRASFDCSSDGPKAQLQSFVAGIDTVRDALKAYRTSLKTLIQAVRQAAIAAHQATPSATPTTGGDL